MAVTRLASDEGSRLASSFAISSKYLNVSRFALVPRCCRDLMREVMRDVICLIMLPCIPGNGIFIGINGREFKLDITKYIVELNAEAS